MVLDFYYFRCLTAFIMRVVACGLAGFLLGGLFGCILAVGQLRQMNKTERGLMTESVFWLYGIGGAVGGLLILGKIGDTINKEEELEKVLRTEQAKREEEKRIEQEHLQQMERELGLRPKPTAEVFKEGRY